MADTLKSNPEKPDSQEAPEGIGGTLSDDDLDKALSEADPEFLKAVQDIGNDTSLSVSPLESADESKELDEERKAWESAGKFGRFSYRIFPFLPKVSFLFKKWKFVLFVILRGDWVRIKNFLYFLATDGKDRLISTIRGWVGSVSGFFAKVAGSFRYLSLRMKVAAFGIAVLALVTGTFIYKSGTKGVVPPKDELFIPTLERVASEVYEYDPATDVEPFYENLRAPTNILLLPKVVVNLKRSGSSGANPMGAFELFLEGMSSEALIEVKDREVEIRDKIQRALEEVTFDQADSPAGKKIICEKVKEEVNSVLTTGEIKKVWIKTVIVKP